MTGCSIGGSFINIVKLDGLVETRNNLPLSTHKKTLNSRGLKKLLPAFNMRYFNFMFIFLSVTMAASFTINLTDWKILSSDKVDKGTLAPHPPPRYTPVMGSCPVSKFINPTLFRIPFV